MDVWEAPSGYALRIDSPSAATFYYCDEYAGDGKLPSSHTKLMVVDKRDGEITIYPHVPGDGGMVRQYSSVEKLIVQGDCVDVNWKDPVQISEEDEPIVSQLPDGFGRTLSYGLGFPRVYRRIIQSVEAVAGCSSIKFVSGDEGGVAGDTFYFPMPRYFALKNEIDLNRKRGYSVVGRINDAIAANAIIEVYGGKSVPVTEGRHPTIQAITRGVTDRTPLSDSEREALVGRMSVEARGVASQSPRRFGKLRQDIELVALEKLVQQVGDLIASKEGEEAWQQFFRTNPFALQQVFSMPVALYGDQVHLRIPGQSGSGARIADFVLLNPLTATIAIVEIKHHRSKLMGKAYRGKDGSDVHPPAVELAGAVAQLQAQAESAKSDYKMILANSPDAGMVNISSVRSVLIVGSITKLSEAEVSSFSRFRDGLSGVDVLAFDEVGSRLRNLCEMLSNED